MWVVCFSDNSLWILKKPTWFLGAGGARADAHVFAGPRAQVCSYLWRLDVDILPLYLPVLFVELTSWPGSPIDPSSPCSLIRVIEAPSHRLYVVSEIQIWVLLRVQQHLTV